MQCGCPSRLEVPDGDNRERWICSACKHVHYQNHTLVVTTIAHWGNKILLCKRANSPQIGYWCLPGGYLEIDETLEQGAARETLEETHSIVEIKRLFCISEFLLGGRLMFCFLGALAQPEYAIGDECLDVKLIEYADIDFDEIAFESHKLALQEFNRDPDGVEVRRLVMKKQVIPSKS